MRAVIFYATREGQSRRVAEHVAECLRGQRFDVHVFNTAGNPADTEFSPSPSARPKLRGL